MTFSILLYDSFSSDNPIIAISVISYASKAHVTIWAHCREVSCPTHSMFHVKHLPANFKALAAEAMPKVLVLLSVQIKIPLKVLANPDFRGAYKREVSHCTVYSRIVRFIVTL